MNLKDFVDPPRQHRPSPLWSWNDVMEPSEIESRIRDLKKKGFGGFFMHSGQGLRTEYLSDDWMRAIRRGVEIARELELEAWLSDEDRGPSGFAGGNTTARNDENLAMALTWTEDASILDADALERVVAFTRTNADGGMELLHERPENITGAGAFFERRYTRRHARFNGEGYPDMLNPDTVKDFIENTHEKYARLFRYDFGRYMPGIFTGGPNVNRTLTLCPGDDQRARSFPWTPGFAEYFEKIHGYSPLDHLHHLLGDSEEGFSFRHDFWRTVNERFIESFAAPVSEWCREHELLFTGHFLFEDDFARMILSGGSVMALYEYLDIPGVDRPGSTVRNPWSIKQASSVANQLGKKRTACGIFGSTAQALSFEDMKRTADHTVALGAAFLSPRMVPHTVKGDGKRDFPPAFFNQQPYWDHLKVMNDYLSRVSWAVSQGQSAASVLVLHPIGSAYGALDIDAENGGDKLQAVESSFRKLVTELIAEHIDFDLGDERILIAHGNAAGDLLRVGEMEYRAVILPRAYTWLSSTLDLLDSFTGPVMIMGDTPGHVSGKPSDRIGKLAGKPGVFVLPDSPGEALRVLADTVGHMVTVTGGDGGAARQVVVNHRTEAAAHLLFLANTDPDGSCEITIGLKALGGVVELDPLSGRAYRYASEFADGITRIRTSLSAGGSRIFLVDQTQTSVIQQETGTSVEEALLVEGPYSFRRLQENTLTLDRCTLEIDGTVVLRDQPVWKARKAIREKTGIAEYEGWQPWKMEARNVRTRTNKTVLTFEFTVTDIPEKLELAMESGDRFTVEVNGKTVEASAGKWHIDRTFPVFTITDHVVEGKNIIRAVTDFLWDTGIENIYLAGDFAVGPKSAGFPIIREEETIQAGSWDEQGYPFYSGAMVYRMEFDLGPIEPYRYEIDLSGARGTNLLITVNDIEIGSLPFAPWRCDITGALKEGANTVEIEVDGSLRNALGPFHSTTENPDPTGPRDLTDEERVTDAYMFVPYGFIEPPKLVKIR